jgi:hypothetical protein
MSSSMNRLDELNTVRPKSSFDMVRRAKELLPSREFLSDAADITTDEEGRNLPKLHKNTEIKKIEKFEKSVVKMMRLFGS